jgi:flagellar hook assembly protein FlgD
VYNPVTDYPPVEVRVHLSLPGPYILKIYNSAGELVKTLKDEREAGAPLDDVVVWDGTNKDDQPVSSGVYVLHFLSRFESRTAKLLILR